MSTATEAKPRLDGGAPSDRASLLLAGVATSIAIVLCLAAVQGLSYIWRSSQFYGHAYAIPLAAAYLAYGNRREFVGALRSLRPPVLGPLVALVAGLFQVATVMGDAGYAAGLGIPIVLGATLYAVGGRGLLRSMLLPLAFLVPMVPPPAFLRDELLIGLKLFLTKVSVFLLQEGGVTVLGEGNRILIPEGTLFVADACSGLTSIVTMLPIACIVAYFLSRGIWRRALVLASVVPLAMAANTVRIVITVLLASRLGLEFAQGSLHQGFGLATYVIGTLAMIGVARLVR